MKNMTMSIFLILIGLGGCFAFGYKFGWNAAFDVGWNAAIDATPKAVIFSPTFKVLGLEKNQLPWYADGKPFYILKYGSVEFSHNNETVAETLSIEPALPKKINVW